MKRSLAFTQTMIRLIVGYTFTLHGAQKVFGLFGGPGLKGFAAMLQGVPEWLSYCAAFSELLGGLMVLVGFAAEIGAMLTMCVMLGALYLVHGSHGFFIQNNGFEYALNLSLLSLMIIINGPGLYYLYDIGHILDRFSEE